MSTVTLRIQVDKAGASENIGAVKRDLQGMGETGAQAGQQAAGGVNALKGAINSAKEAVASFIAVYAGIRTLAGIVNLADEYQGLSDRLRLATAESGTFEAAQAGVFAIAQQTGTALSAVGGLYVALTNSTKALGLSQGELQTITQAVTQSFIVSGASASQTDAAIRQLGQGFSSGVLRGDEFNSMMENAPSLAAALAASLGVTTGELRAMAAEGKLTSDVLAQGLLQQAPAIAAQFDQMGTTVGRAFTQLSNAVLKFVGEASQSTGAASSLAAAITAVANNIDTLARALGAAGVAVGVFIGARGVAALVGAFQAAATSIALTAAPIGAFITGATGAAAATSAWAVAGSGLFTLMGGWIGIAAAAAAGIYYLATAETEAEEAARGADDAIAALAGATGKLREKALAAVETQLALNEELLKTKQEFVNGLTDGSTYAAFFGDILAPRVTRAREEVNELGNSILRMRAASAGEWTIVSPTAEAGISALTLLMNQFRSSTDLSAEAGRNLATGQAALAGALNGTGTAIEKQTEAGAKLRDKLLELDQLERKFPALAGEINAARAQLLASYNETATAVPKLTAAQKALNTAEEEGKAASEALTREQERLAAAAGGPLVAAYVDLAQKLRAVDEWEVKLRADQGLSAQEAERLRTVRVGLTAALVKEVQAVQSLQSPYQTYLSKLEDERRLLGLSATERARAESQIRAVANVMTFANAERQRGNGLLIEEIEKLILHEQQLDRDAAATARANAETLKWQQYWEGATDAVLGAFGDLFSGGIDSLEEFGDQMLQISQRIVSDIVKEFARTGQIRLPTGMFGAGGTGSTVGGWLSAIGTAYGALQNARNGGSALSTIGGFAVSGAQIAGPVGAAVGAIVGGLVAAFSGDNNPLLRVRSSEFSGPRRSEGRATSQLGNIFIRTENTPDGAGTSPEIAQRIADFDNLIASFLSADQLSAIRGALSNVNDTFENGAFTIENALNSRFGTILGALDSNIQEFVGTTGTLEQRVARLTDALTLAAIAAGDNGISSSFDDLATLFTRFRLQGENVSDTFQRLSFGVGLIDDTLLMLGGTFQGTRLQAATFAGELIELAGGLDQFSARLNGALEALFSEPERNQFLASQAQAALNESLRGLNISGTGIESIREQLRTQLRDAMAAGNSALVNELLIAGNALGSFTTAVGRLGDEATGALSGVVLGGTSTTIRPGGGLTSPAGTAVQTQIQAVQTTNTILQTQTSILQQIATNTGRGTVGVGLTPGASPKAGGDATAVLVQIKGLIEQAVRTQVTEALKRTTGANKRAATV